MTHGMHSMEVNVTDSHSHFFPQSTPWVQVQSCHAPKDLATLCYPSEVDRHSGTAESRTAHGGSTNVAKRMRMKRMRMPMWSSYDSRKWVRFANALIWKDCPTHPFQSCRPNKTACLVGATKGTVMYTNNCIVSRCWVVVWLSAPLSNLISEQNSVLTNSVAPMVT